VRGGPPALGWFCGELTTPCHKIPACYEMLHRALDMDSWNIKIYKTIVLPVVLYGYETLSLTFREEHRLRVFGNRVLRRIFEPKRGEVTGGWRKLNNEELHNLCS
jgi:hypothetical protein